jgi:hypothetical protein
MNLFIEASVHLFLLSFNPFRSRSSLNVEDTPIRKLLLLSVRAMTGHKCFVKSKDYTLSIFNFTSNRELFKHLLVPSSPVSFVFGLASRLLEHLK